MLATLLLCAVPFALVAWIRHDLREYAAFGRETTSIGRRAFYLRWSWQGFVALTGAALVVLAVLGRLGDLLAIPPELAALAPAPTPELAADDDDGAIGFVIGATLGLAVLIGVQHLRLRRTRALMIGNVAPLLPRDRAETFAAIPLCVSAGVSEELFFRLALPLLVTTVTGSALVGLAVGVVVFGIAHAYQGYKGVLGTAAMGALFTWLYLGSGSLLRPMLVHTAVDLVALVVRPSLVRWSSRSRV